jgi:hypothetical protein
VGHPAMGDGIEPKGARTEFSRRLFRPGSLQHFFVFPLENLREPQGAPQIPPLRSPGFPVENRGVDGIRVRFGRDDKGREVAQVGVAGGWNSASQNRISCFKLWTPRRCSIPKYPASTPPSKPSSSAPRPQCSLSRLNRQDHPSRSGRWVKGMLIKETAISRYSKRASEG